METRKLRQDASNFNRTFIESHKHVTDINSLWNYLKENLLKMMEDNVPSKMTSSKNHQPWITTETKRILRRKKRWFKRLKNCPSDKNLQKYRELKRSSQRLCRKAHENYVNDLICEDKNNKKNSFLTSAEKELKM